MRPRIWLPGLLILAFIAPGAVKAEGGHPHGDLALECTDCHTTESWTPAASPMRFSHGSTGFLLTGAHAAVDCLQCHQSLFFSHVGTSCSDCHRDVHTGELGVQCERCHDTSSWENQRRVFDVHNSTLFPLFTVHAALECAACHQGQRPFEYATTPTECAGCHMETFEQTAAPDHAAVGFPTDCRQCHLPMARSWRPAAFSHPGSFPLAGAHRLIACSECHGESLAAVQRECVACHRDDYQATVSPNHVSGRFSTECQACHGVQDWVPATFRHEQSAFPLVGAHARIDCSDCHSQGFGGTPTDCVACHRNDFTGTRDPNHAAAGFSTDCQGCHSQEAWRPATSFNHAQSAFPLQGAHARLDCSACHSQGFAGTPRECVGCHRQDYNNTRDPNHKTSNFPTNCESCHSQNAWEPASFNHNSFPLVGAHTRVDCSACHTQGYAGTPRECVACHRQDYNNTRDPNHKTSNFPTNCESCHSQNAWEPASFNHNSFPLVGAHTRVDCSACHTQGYAGTPRECVACHRQDYNNTRDPNHAAAGFPTNCEACHNTNRWEDAQFNHDQIFPIYSGSHRGEWTACSDCHPSASSFAVFSCINCHEHSRSRTDREHDEVRNYQYDSQACLSCHPRGRE